MKRIILFISTFLLVLACQEKSPSRKIDSVSIQEFKMDSISIRAIQIITKNKIAYAGSNGHVGLFSDKEKDISSKLKIKYQDSIIPNFRSIAFNGIDYFALSIGNPTLLYKISNDTATLVYKEIHQKTFYDSMHFFEDKLHGIAIGDPTENCASIIVTSNGGETWNKIPCTKLPVFEENEAFFAASNTNIKTIGSTVWIASGGKKARVLKSQDYGVTWQIFNTPIIQGNGPQGIYSIDFSNKNNGIIIGGDYSKPLENSANKAITKDGGETWKLVANRQNPNYKSCVQYVPNTNGKEIFAVGKTGISFSNDGGLSWKKISNESYYAIQFLDKNTAWLSGNNKIGKLILN